MGLAHPCLQPLSQTFPTPSGREILYPFGHAVPHKLQDLLPLRTPALRRQGPRLVLRLERVT